MRASLRLVLAALALAASAASSGGCVLNAGPLDGQGAASNVGGAGTGGAGAGAAGAGAAGMGGMGGAAGSTGGSTVTMPPECMIDSDCKTFDPTGKCATTKCDTGKCSTIIMSDGVVCAPPANGCFDESRCASGVCAVSQKSPGTVLVDPSNNCAQLVCDAKGQPMAQMDPTDTPAPQDGCHVGVCNNGQVEQNALPDGTGCKIIIMGDGQCIGGSCCLNALACGGACCVAVCCNSSKSQCDFSCL